MSIALFTFITALSGTSEAATTAASYNVEPSTSSISVPELSASSIPHPEPTLSNFPDVPSTLTHLSPNK